MKKKHNIVTSWKQRIFSLILLFTLSSCFGSQEQYLNLAKGNHSFTYDLEFSQNIDMQEIQKTYEKRFELAGLNKTKIEDLGSKKIRLIISDVKDSELLIPIIAGQGQLGLQFARKQHSHYQAALDKIGIKDFKKNLSLIEWKQIQALQNTDPQVKIMSKKQGSQHIQVYFIETKKVLSNQDLSEISLYPPKSSINFFPQPPLRGFHIKLKPEVSAAFAQLTRNHIGDELAFIIDGEIIQVPRILEEINQGALMLDYGVSGLKNNLDYKIGLAALLIRTPLKQKPMITKTMQSP